MSINEKVKIKNLPNMLKDDINEIAIGKKPYLVGSGSVTSITYNSDYDINEQMIGRNLDTYMKSHLKKVNDDPTIWLISYHKTETYYQINTICNIDGLLVDVNNTIWVKREPSKKEKIISLKEDIDILIRDGNYWKAVKRLYTLLSIESGNKKELKILSDFLNSNIGLLANIINQLEIILTFQSKSTNSRKEKLLINSNIEITKLHLNSIYSVPIEDKLFNLFTITKLRTLIKLLNEKLQSYTKKWVYDNYHLFI